MLCEYTILEEELKKYDKDMRILLIDSKNIVFEERVRLNCFHCKRYSTNWTCPPKIPDIDYKKLISEYNNLAIVSIELKIDNNYEDIRNASTNKLHRGLLYLEKFLFNNNYPLSVSFIGGGCKLCKDGCAEDKCRQPYSARIPIEAIGINVVKTLKNIDIDVIFPVVEKISRYGMILW
jgi:predicted metal-binding protein